MAPRILPTLIALVALAACGEPRREHAAAPPASGATRPDLARIRQIALAEAPGEILSVEPERNHGRDTYEIKVLARTGRIIEVEIDAATGAVLKREAE